MTDEEVLAEMVSWVLRLRHGQSMKAITLHIDKRIPVVIISKLCVCEHGSWPQAFFDSLNADASKDARIGKKTVQS